jgi:hypothetical protein
MEDTHLSMAILLHIPSSYCCIRTSPFLPSSVPRSCARRCRRHWASSPMWCHCQGAAHHRQSHSRAASLVQGHCELVPMWRGWWHCTGWGGTALAEQSTSAPPDMPEEPEEQGASASPRLAWPKCFRRLILGPKRKGNSTMRGRGVSLWLIDTESPMGKKAAFGRGDAARGKLLAGERTSAANQKKSISWLEIAAISRGLCRAPDR